MRTTIIKTLEEIFDQTGLTLEDILPGTNIDDVVETMDQTGLTFEELVEINR